jgi:hypothetical protein
VQLLNSYSERSVGGKGVHVIFRGTKPGTKCRVGPYELYDSGRYFTVSGHHIEGTPTTVENRTAEVAALYARLFPNGHHSTSNAAAHGGEHALTPEAIEQVIYLSEREDVADQQTTLAKERKDVDKRIGRLIAAIETGGDAASLVAKVRELETRRRAIDSEIASLQPIPRLEPAVIETRLGEWRRLLRQSTTQARTVLQRVLKGRVTFTPRADGQGYDFEAPTRFDKLFTGIVAKRPTWIADGDVTGTEHIRPEDTLDVDYGELLDRVCQKEWRALQDSNLRPPGS